MRNIILNSKLQNKSFYRSIKARENNLKIISIHPKMVMSLSNTNGKYFNVVFYGKQSVFTKACSNNSVDDIVYQRTGKYQRLTHSKVSDVQGLIE